MSSRNIASIGLAITILSLAMHVDAAVIAEDAFAYANGDLGGQNGGTGSWATAWTPLSGATNSDWVVNNGVASTTGNDLDDNRYMRRQVTLPNPTTATVYFRYDYKMPTLSPGEDTINGGIYGGVSFGAGALFASGDVTVYSQEYAGANHPYHLRLRTGSDNTLPLNSAGPALDYNRTYVIVGRIEPNYINVGDTRVTVWLNPTSESDPAYLQTITNSFTWGLGTHYFSLYRESHNFTSVSYDNVRIGTEYYSVVPEPASAVVLAAAGCCIIARRKR